MYPLFAALLTVLDVHSAGSVLS